MQAFADVQALVFDVFGTVVDWRGGVARESARFPRTLCARRRSGRLRRRMAAPLFAGDGRGALRASSIRASGRVARENLEAVLPEFGIDRSAVPPSELDALNLAWHRLDPWPDLVPGLTRLRAPVHHRSPLQRQYPADARLGEARRPALGRHSGRWSRAGLQADAGGVSAHALRALMLEPEQVCLVAAHNSDLAAARRCGLRAAFIPRPTEHGPDPDD